MQVAGCCPPPTEDSDTRSPAPLSLYVEDFVLYLARIRRDTSSRAFGGSTGIDFGVYDGLQVSSEFAGVGTGGYGYDVHGARFERPTWSHLTMQLVDRQLSELGHGVIVEV